MALTAKKVYAILKRQISDMEAKLNSPVRYRGTVATADLLPLNPDIGDMYNIESKSVYGEAGMNVAWTGEIWDTLGPAIDMAPYLREDSEIITSLKTKTENLESANYTDRGTLADTDAFLINDGTGMKKSVLSKLSDFVLNKIADKVFAKLQTNDKTILGAINELNSKVFIKTQNLSTFSINIKLNKNIYTSFIMYGATSQKNGFMYIVFIDVASAKRAVNFIKIADFLAGRTFSGTYSDDTSTLTINASDTIWGGIKLLMFKEENY
jgi:hypothetical protein